MRPINRYFAVAVSIAALGAGAAFAQTPTTGANPAQRGAHDSFFYGPLNGTARGETLANGLDTNQIGRPKTNRGAVTPVPEPSQWAMMLAGLALVGVIVKRRNAQR
jgi:PEP-CTERM motif-containing protein